MTAIRAQRRSVAPPPPDTSRPRSDGRRVLFEVLVEGHAVPCAISQHALRDIVTGGKRMNPGDILHCFALARTQIEALALRKIQGRRGAPQGVLYIWPEDAEDEAPDTAAS